MRLAYFSQVIYGELSVIEIFMLFSAIRSIRHVGLVVQRDVRDGFQSGRRFYPSVT